MQVSVMLQSKGLDVVTVARRPAPNRVAAIVEGCGGRYVSTRETPLAEVAAALPPLDLVLEATGVGPLAFEAMSLLGSNGVLVLLSLTGGDTVAPVPVDLLNREWVLGNKVLVGSVNAAHEDFTAGVEDLERFEARWPGLTERLITHRLNGFADVARIAGGIDEGIKTVIEFGEG